MTFDDWLISLDRALRNSRRGLKVRDIDPIALREAYDRGDSPIAFSKLPVLPTRHRGTQSARPKRRPVWIVFGVLVVLAAGAYRYVNDFTSAREGESRLAMIKRWPATLPIKTASGFYYPPGADKAEQQAQEEIKKMLLQPNSAVFSKVGAVKFDRPSSFQVNGNVEAINQFNARVLATWSIWVLQTGEKVKFAPPELEVLPGGANIWRAGVQGMQRTQAEVQGSYTQYVGSNPNRKLAPNKTAPQGYQVSGSHSRFVNTLMGREQLILDQTFRGRKTEGTRPFKVASGSYQVVCSIPVEEDGAEFTLKLTNQTTSETFKWSPSFPKPEVGQEAVHLVESLTVQPGTYFFDVTTTASQWSISVMHKLR